MTKPDLTRSAVVTVMTAVMPVVVRAAGVSSVPLRPSIGKSLTAGILIVAMSSAIAGCLKAEGIAISHEDVVLGSVLHILGGYSHTELAQLLVKSRDMFLQYHALGEQPGTIQAAIRATLDNLTKLTIVYVQTGDPKFLQPLDDVYKFFNSLQKDPG